LIPYQDFPWGGGHIPPSFPSIGSGSFPSSGPNPFMGWGGPMGSGFQSMWHVIYFNPFTLYGGFRSNPFTTSAVSVGGNPFQGQWNPMQGSFSSKGCHQGETPFSVRISPCKDFFLRKGGQQGETLLFHLGTRWVEVFLHLTRANKVSSKSLAHLQALPGNLVPVPIQVILFQLVLNLELPTSLAGIMGPSRGYLFWKC
jgi:hypothetical protein